MKPNNLLPKVQLAPEEGVFELGGSVPVWIWVRTCPMLKCKCRNVLIIATSGGRALLQERCAAIHDAWNAGDNYLDAAASLDDLIVFLLDFDSNQVFSILNSTQLDLSPQDISKRIDGEVLDSIARLVFRGKGLPDPEQEIQLAADMVLKNFHPGEMVAWRDAFNDVRLDYYVLGNRIYEACEMYCIKHNCGCENTVLFFRTQGSRDMLYSGSITVHQSGRVKIEPEIKDIHRMERLWALYQLRYPNFLQHFARRYSVMRSIGAQIAGVLMPVKVPPRVGRNEFCPCGSGKKYKKCCGAS